MKQKVLFLLHVPPPIHGSGVVGYGIKTSKLINETFNSRFINIIISTNILETRKVTLSKISSLFRILNNLLKELRYHKPDLCYLALSTTGAAFYKDLLLVLLLKISNTKIVLHLHNKGISNKLDKLILKNIYSFVFAKSEVILLSERLYADIQEIVPRNRVHICPNGIKAIKNRIRDYENPIPKVLFLSNLIKSKGVYELIQACEIIKSKGINFTCTIAGEEGDVSVSMITDYIKTHHLLDTVNCVGPKYNKEKEDLFQNADIFVFPTYYTHETFGLVNLEAMQHSLPIVSTFEGGIPDVVLDGKTGYLVQQKNINELAEKLELLLINPKLRKKFGNAGNDRYKQLFTFNIFEQRLTSILNEVLKR